ncbi:MAG: FecR family protein [Prevotella sp.]
MSNNNKEIDKILDFFDGKEELTDDEILAVFDTEEGRKAWNELMDLDEAANRLMGKQPNVDAEWAAFEKKMQDKTEIQPKRRTVSIGLAWKVVAAAAAAILLLVVLNYKTPVAEQDVEPEVAIAMEKAEVEQHEERIAKAVKAKKIKMIKVEVPAGEMTDVVLPDGTEVCLNAKSTLEYPETFEGKMRLVSLNGEGYFKVSHDKRHPFVIKANDVTTRVLGTEFNVRCYDAADVHVTLVEGSVEVASNINKVKISPNQDACLAEGKLVVANVNPKDFTSWREGLMYFDNATLRTILHQIGAWYNVSVVCDKSSLLDKHFHYMFNVNDSIEKAIQLLRNASDLDITVDDNTIQVK